MENKRELGKFYTDYNPFKNKHFKSWFKKALEKSNNSVLEPFAGANNIIRMLEEDYKFDYTSYDIEPASKDVKKRDTIKNFPTDFVLAVTNPPYLSRVSASRRNINYPDTDFNDLYKVSLNKMLHHCDYIAAIVPTTVINSIDFLDRLEKYILLNKKMFDSTDTPTCLALFSPLKEVKKTKVYDLNNSLGTLEEIKDFFEKWSPKRNMHGIKFNSKKGNLFLHAIDNNDGPTIRFGFSSELNISEIKNSSRHKTLIEVPFEVNEDVIKILNEFIYEYRKNTNDILMNTFMNLRKDGKFRRRLDYSTARRIIEKYFFENVKKYEVIS